MGSKHHGRSRSSMHARLSLERSPKNEGELEPGLEAGAITTRLWVHEGPPFGAIANAWKRPLSLGGVELSAMSRDETSRIPDQWERNAPVAPTAARRPCGAGEVGEPRAQRKRRVGQAVTLSRATKETEASPWADPSLPACGIPAMVDGAAAARIRRWMSSKRIMAMLLGKQSTRMNERPWRAISRKGEITATRKQIPTRIGNSDQGSGGAHAELSSKDLDREARAADFVVVGSPQTGVRRPGRQRPSRHAELICNYWHCPRLWLRSFDRQILSGPRSDVNRTRAIFSFSLYSRPLRQRPFEDDRSLSNRERRGRWQPSRLELKTLE